MAKRRGNFIKLDRKILDWEWYDDPATKIVFLDLLLNANFKDGSYRGIPLKKGEVVFGRKRCSERTGLTERQVRTAIDHLKTSGEISTSKSTSKFTVIKVEKWGFYQGQDEESDQQATSKRPASDQQTTTSKNEKNEKNEKNRERGTTHQKKPRGRKGNVLLTDEDYQSIKDKYDQHVKLINKVDAYLANTERTYKDHESLIYRIAENDNWPTKRMAEPRNLELTPEEIRAIKEQDEKWRNEQ